MIALNVLAAWLLADFLTGLVHWWEDRILKPSRIGFLNNILDDNELHHSKPTALTVYSYWQNINTSVIFTIPLSFAAFWIGAPVVVWLAIFFASFGNLVHRFAHEPQRKRPLAVRFLQFVGIFISHDHHFSHHYSAPGQVITKDETTWRYCPMTNWVNPVLDRVKFWRALEIVIGHI